MTNDISNIDPLDARNCTCANLRRATRVVTQAYDAALRPVGLRATQFTMLSVLVKQGQMRQSDFAEILGMDGTTLTRNLQPLLKSEWVQIDREDDQRVRLISITKQGLDIVELASPLWRGIQTHFVEGLGNAHWSEFLSALSQTADMAKQK